MTKQKSPTRKGVATKRRKILSDPLHRRRAWWFAVLTSGMILIQLAYNLHSSGQPQVLGYATSMSTDGLLQSTNDYRARSDKPALQHNSALDRAAQTEQPLGTTFRRLTTHTRMLARILRTGSAQTIKS
jgi:hypothetical protein